MKTKLAIGIISFVLGISSTYAIQKIVSLSQAQAHSKPTLLSAFSQSDTSPDTSMDNFLNDFFDDDFFGHSRDPFADIRHMREKMMKQFGEVERGPLFDSWYRKKFGGGSVGEIKMREDDGYVYYDILVQGLNKEKLDVKVTEGQIHISGQVQEKSNQGNSESYFSSSFHRSFPAPSSVDASKVQMEHEKDKLVIKFPKTKRRS